MTRRAQSGQASVELLGGLPVLIVLGVALFQLLAVGYAAVLAGNAAESGALSIAAGGDGRSAAREAVPGWSVAGMRVSEGAERITVTLRPPSPIRAVARRLEVSATAAVETP